jgi:chemotaxis signal transduction protein
MGEPFAMDIAMTPTQALSAGFELEAAVAAPQRASRHEETQLRQGFRIGDLGLMIRYEDGSELTEMPDVYRLPNAPDWFCGVANLHGVLTPVFELARYLGVPRDAQAKRMLLVLSRGADAAGIVIDGMPERLRFREEHRVDDAPVPAQLESNVAGTYWVGERAWMDFKPADLFNRIETELSDSATSAG